MRPILFHLGSLTIYSYGVIGAAGFLTGLFLAYRRAPRAGLDPNKIWNLTIYGVLIALGLAKIWLVLGAWDYYSANPREIFSMATLQSAGTFYGGLIGAVVWTVLYTRFQKMPTLAVLDVMAAPLALGHAIARLGCFAAGCCYGRPTAVGWGVTYSDPIAERISGTPLGVALHPTQLYESAAEFLNFGILLWIGAKRRLSGQLIGTYFILYGIERGTIEFFRGDPGRTLLFHGRVSLMQMVSIGLIATGSYLWLRRGENAAPANPPAPARAAASRS